MITISVYTRHSADCSRTDIAYRRCTCPKWLYWMQDGRKIREAAGTRSWEAATERARLMEADINSGRSADRDAITIDKAISTYLADKEAIGLTQATISKLKTIFEKQLLAFCTTRRITRVEQLSTAVLTEWRSEWKDGDLSRKKKFERVKGFFYFCQGQGWIEKNPTMGMRRVKATPKPTDYFTREEFEKIVDAVYLLYHDVRVNGKELRERLLTFLLLLRWSGLRIRDAVTLERSRLQADDNLLLYMAKTGQPVFVPLPPEVASRLRTVPAGPKPNPRYFFWSGNGDPKSGVADWQRSLRALFEQAGLKHGDGSLKRCHPHMLRDTFAVEMLLGGVPLDQVSRLLGHSSVKITEASYSPWVHARQKQLEESVKKAWMVSNPPTPNVQSATA